MEAKLHTGYSTNDRQERNEREISFPGSLSPPHPRDPGSEVDRRVVKRKTTN